MLRRLRRSIKPGWGLRFLGLRGAELCEALVDLWG
jgi:hypothetical protein